MPSSGAWNMSFGKVYFLECLIRISSLRTIIFLKIKNMVIKLVKGTVKWFDGRKGFGFINSEDEIDVFVHFSALAGNDDEYKTLNENDEVEFELTEGQKGPQASNVVVTKKAPPQQSLSYGGGGGGGGRGGGGRGGKGRGGKGRGGRSGGKKRSY